MNFCLSQQKHQFQRCAYKRNGEEQKSGLISKSGFYLSIYTLMEGEETVSILIYKSDDGEGEWWNWRVPSYGVRASGIFGTQTLRKMPSDTPHRSAA